MRRSSHGAAFAAASLALTLAAPSAHAAGEQIMPLSEVRAGMACQAATVISGTEPVSFDATVISVEGGPRPTDAGIVMRFSGDAVAAGGIASGFSGSPVRCPRADGTLGVIGAIAYGIGQYDNLVGQVTPIEAMLGMPATADAPGAPAIGVAAPSTTAAPAKSSKAAKKARAAASRAGTAATADPRSEIPLTLSGPKGPLAAAFTSAASKAGKRLLISPVANRSQAAAPAGLQPGDAIAATSVFGDVSAGAIGTVTYVDGDKVYAFGHPSSGTGAVRLQMERARISTIIASPTIGDQASYKLGTPIGAVGTIGFDGAFGVAGLLGAPPATIPVSATVRDAGGAIVQEAKASVVDERPVRGGSTGSLLALASAANAGTAMQRLTSQASISGSARACTTIYLKGEEKPLSECIDTIVPQAGAEGGVETGIAEAVVGAIGPVASAERFLKLVDRVAVDVRFRREADTAEIIKVRAPKHPKAGSTITARVTVVQGTTGDERVIPVKVRIPRYAVGAPTGIVVLADAVEPLPADEDALDALFADEESTPAPKTLASLRTQYTPSGISGLRAVVVPGIGGSAVKGGLLGDEDSELTDDDLESIIGRVKLVWELPAVAATGAASVTVNPRR